MTQTEIKQDPTFDSLLQPSPAEERLTSMRVERLHAAAAKALERMRLPNNKDEEWRFTPLTSFKAHTFHSADGQLVKLNACDVVRYFVAEADRRRLVFVDGVYAPQLSSVSELPAGLVVTTLAEAPGEFLEGHLGYVADLEDEVFTALNCRHVTQGAAVILPRHTKIEEPIQLLFVATGQQHELVTYPRVLVVAGPGAEATVIEAYICLHEGVYFTDAVSEIVVNPQARLTHVRVQSESRNGFHVGRTAVRLEKDAYYATQAITLGGKMSRYDLDVTQTAEGTECHLDGLALLGGEQEADSHTCLDHQQALGTSTQLHKTIVDARAHAVFNGRIHVAKGAQQTNSSQQSRNLLLSDRARVDTKPELEIFADDVKCAHGATVGQISQDELFYLKSRGLNDVQARDLLTYAFAAEVIDKVPVASLRKQLQNLVLQRTDRTKREA